jgi:AcrR family transcriptional regulator
MEEARSKARRLDALSKNRIVRAAIEILDSSGEDGLTTRSLAASLKTGSGAIFHHVGSRDELLRSAADSVVADVTAGIATETTPEESIRLLMIGVFDTIHAHPWVGAQLAREPWQTALLEIFLEIGSRLQALGVLEVKLFDAASTLLSYLLGVASQHAAGASLARHTDRAAFLSAAVEDWLERREPLDHPFVRQVTRLADHDDRAQFIAGLDVIMDGITLHSRRAALRSPVV